MAFSEDLTLFFDTDDFGSEATWNATTVDGIFGHAYVEIEGLASERPLFLCVESDVSSIDYGDAFVTNSTNYTVADIQPDGTGLVLLVLQEA